MNFPVVFGDLLIDGEAFEKIKVIRGTVVFQSSEGSLDTVRVGSVVFQNESFGNHAKIKNLALATATIDGTGNILEAGNASKTVIEIGGVDNTVKVASGKVSYKISGSFTDVDDGNGDSDFFVDDAFAFRISDGAGDDTIIVDGGNGVINLGDGADTIWVKSGFVDIFDFVPGEDTLLIGASGSEVPVESSIAVDFVDANGNFSGVIVIVADTLV